MTRTKGILISILLLAVPCVASGHDGSPQQLRDLPHTWELDPLVIFSLLVAGGLYLLGVRNLWHSAGKDHGVKRSEAVAYAAGWATLFVALVSPLHPLGQVLFSAHMTQHELLMLVAAPLIVLGRPVIPFLWALPRNLSLQLGTLAKKAVFQKSWRAVTKPLTAWAVHAIALWFWHVPVFFQATLKSDLIHTLQHISFLGSALLFWWALLHAPRSSLSYGAGTLYLFTTSIHSGLLGALITFAATVLYPAYSLTTSRWGLTPLEDQQLGGLIMWVPAGLVYIVAGLALCAGWIRESERTALRSERDSIDLRTAGSLEVLSEVNR